MTNVTRKCILSQITSPSETCINKEFMA